MKNRFVCCVLIAEQVLHKKEYKTLKDIAGDLNLTYQQVADLSTGRPNKFFNNQFKFAPTIKIEKISNQV